jgi:hypothetical protein
MQEKRTITGGLNFDDDITVIPNGDYRYALNMRLSKSDKDSEGLGENTRGNTKYHYNLDNGDNKCIGACNDSVNKKIYYCVWNSQSNHKVLEFDLISNNIVLVASSSLFNFQKDKLILDSFVIDGTYHINDRYNSPKEVHIERSKISPLSINLQDIEAIKYAPNNSPIAEFKNSADLLVPDLRKTNSVRNKLFQFTYKYVYLDNQESAWSPYSKVSLPIAEAGFRPFAYYPPEFNNVISVQIPINGNNVKSVKIAARNSNVSDFFLVEEVGADIIQNQNSYTFNFFNDEVYTPIDNTGDAGMRLFDRVPLKSEGQALIDGNRKAYGGITDGYDPVDIDIDVEVIEQQSPQSDPPAKATPLVLDQGAFNSINWSLPSWGGQVVNHPLFHSQTFYWGAPNDTINGVDITQYCRRFTGYDYNKNYWQVYVSNKKYLNPSVANNILNYRDRSEHANSAGVKYNLGGTDRTMLWFTNEGAALKYHNAAGTLYNEVHVGAPDGEGTRYSLKIRMRYIDIGYSNSDIFKTKKVQYTSIAGDTAQDVGFALIQLLKDAVNMYRPDNRNVFLNLSETTGGYSILNNNNVTPGSYVIQIYGEGFVPQNIDFQHDFAYSGGHMASASNNNIQGYTWSNTDVDNLFVHPATPALTQLDTDLQIYSSWTAENRKSLKAGATHGVGMVYYDDPNRSGLTNIKEKSFYVPFFSERNLQGEVVSNDTDLQITINHTPPSWAKYYQIVYTGNKTIEKIPTVDGSGYSGFIQTRINNYLLDVNGKSSAKIQYLYDYNDTIPEDTQLTYSFSKGDRVRFITKELKTTNKFEYLTDYSDVEVLAFDEVTKIVTFKTPSIVPKNGSLIELYTPKKKNEKDIYYEVGEVFPILNGFHGGTNNQNQTSVNPAIILLDDIGDVYIRYRVAPINFPVEDYSYSDYYESDMWDRGRGNIVDNNIGETFRKTTIRYSDPFIPETNINGLSQFNDLAFSDYDHKYGAIKLIYSEDKNLIVFQQLKTGIIGVNQTTLYDNEGKEVGQIGSDTKVLSDIRYYTGEFGIGDNPESFAVRAKVKYFTDIKNGAVLRLSGNGLTPISEYKAHNYFTDTFDYLSLSTSKFKVLGEYDVRFGEYLLSIQEEDIYIKKYLNAGEIKRAISVDTIEDSDFTIIDDSLVNAGTIIQDEEIDLSGNTVPSGTEPILLPPVSLTDIPLNLNEAPNNLELGGSLDLDDGTSKTFTFDDGTVVPFADIVFILNGTPYVMVLSDVAPKRETIAFSESDNRWADFYSFIPDFMVEANIGIITFKDGQLYIHNTNDVYNNFYGEQFTSKIQIPSNAAPSNIKFYTNISQESTSPFAVIEATNHNGQKTSLLVTDFEDVESVWKAAFLMDENTPNIANPLIEGDVMRGNSMMVTLENTDTDFVKLKAVNFIFEGSELSNR